ncbi:MAG: DUF2167 domain-containing protein [Alphaproteobacteria bacterium]|nr:MAG: DUF2167 domain-containing protein [Alphaproteobacteria bacterium]
MYKWLIFAVFAALATPVAVIAEEETTSTEVTGETESQFTEEELAYFAWANEFQESLTPQTGVIDLPGGFAKLTVPENFYYLSPSDAKRVLEEAWGNPPQEAPNLGMLFPVEHDPFTYGSWAVEIDFEEEGYVKDDDAEDIDYDELLEQMKKDTAAANPDRVAAGYDEVELVGWAAPPHYDKETKKLYWAKEIHFSSMETNTLNYNIRVLGRKGYLLLNFIAGMEELGEIEGQLDTVLAMAEFKEGSQYRDFDPDIDKVAAYGIGGLIAGKVLLKSGIIAGALVFLKKFIVIIVVAVGGFFARIFKRGKKEEV